MKSLALLLVGTAGLIGGCATLEMPNPQPGSGSTAIKSGSATPTQAPLPKPPLHAKQSLVPLSQGISASTEEQPDAVIKIDPKTGTLTGEMEGRLQKIVEEARQDEHTLIRLESFVPGGGSSGFDLGKADQTLQLIRDRLIGSGISQRRILLSSFGAEHDIQRDPTRHWIEIYLLRIGSAPTHVSSAARRHPEHDRPESGKQ